MISRSLHVVDLHQHVMSTTSMLRVFSTNPVPREEREVIAKNLIQNILDDLITENLFWTTDDTVADPDRYRKMIHIPLGGREQDVLDHIDNLITAMEDVLTATDLFPSWSYAELSVKQFMFIIHLSGDYRIDDWMSKQKKIKTTRLSK